MLPNAVGEWWHFESGSIRITMYTTLWVFGLLRRLLRPLFFLITVSVYFSNLSSKEFITLGYSRRICFVVNNLDTFIMRIFELCGYGVIHIYISNTHFNSKILSWERLKLKLLGDVADILLLY